MSDHAHVPPQALEAEESVLGAMMLAPGAIEAATEHVQPDDFYRSSHGLIYTAALDLHSRSEPVDALTLVAELEDRGQLADVGGRQRIQELAALVPASSNAGHWAKIVADTAGLRRLLRAGHEITGLVENRTGDLDQVAERAEQALTKALTSHNVTDFEPVSTTITGIADEIETAYKNGEVRFGVKTGYLDLDRTLLGLQPGTLTIIAARPSMGKSALALNIAENIADRGDHVGISSLEMSKAELTIRQLSRTARIDSQTLRTAKLDEGQYEKFKQARVKLGQRTALHVDDSPGTTAATLRASLRRLHRQHNVKCGMVDYLQLMLSGRTEDSRQQEIASITRSLKLLARELNIPIVALSQLNRELERREDKRPRLSDLRDSGAIEQDADTVLFIYRDDYYHQDSDAVGIAEIIVAKNRMGPSGTLKLAFNGRHSTFLNLSQGGT